METYNTFKDYERHMYTRKSPGRPHSHTVLSSRRDGDAMFKKTWSIPNDNLAMFLTTAAKHIVSKYSSGVSAGCIVEQKSDVFPLFFDIDAKTRSSCGNFEPILMEIYNAVCEVYKKPVRMYASKASKICVLTPATATSTAEYKHGVHMIFPEIFVSTAVAISVRKIVIQSLGSIACPFTNGWENAIDESVLKGSGLRMLWFDKGDAATPERVYVPWLEVSNGDIKYQEYDDGREVNGIPYLSFNGTVMMLKKWTIRTPYAKLTECSLPEDDARSVVSAGTTFAAQSIRVPPEVMVILEKRINSCFKGSLLEVIRKEDHEEILNGDLRITAVIPNLVEDEVVSYILKTDKSDHSRWCINKRSKHTVNNVYFVMSKNQIYQRCFSDHDHRGVCCKDFRGPRWSIPNKRFQNFFFDELK